MSTLSYLIMSVLLFSQILKEDITPTLTKLKEERSSYLEYQKIIRELEHLNKLYIAYQFVFAEVQIFTCFKLIVFISRRKSPEKPI